MRSKIILVLLLFIISINTFNINSIAESKSQQENDFSLTVLCYHNIRIIPKNDYDVSLSEFDNQMKYLYDNNFTTLFASEVVKLLKEKTININDKNQNCSISDNNINNQNIYDQKENKKYIAITFDDGNDGVYFYLDKILSKYGFKATLYIYPSIIFSKEKNSKKHYMTFKQINSLLKTNRYELGCHSYYHPYMTKEDEKGLILNTIKAKETLFQKTGYEPVTFAYPFGLYNDKVIDYVKKAGFSGAFTVDRKFVTKNTDLYKIPRFIITRDTSFEKFIKIVNGK